MLKKIIKITAGVAFISSFAMAGKINISDITPYCKIFVGEMHSQYNDNNVLHHYTKNASSVDASLELLSKIYGRENLTIGFNQQDGIKSNIGMRQIVINVNKFYSDFLPKKVNNCSVDFYSPAGLKESLIKNLTTDVAIELLYFNMKAIYNQPVVDILKKAATVASSEEDFLKRYIGIDYIVFANTKNSADFAKRIKQVQLIPVLFVRNLIFIQKHTNLFPFEVRQFYFNVATNNFEKAYESLKKIAELVPIKK